MFLKTTDAELFVTSFGKGPATLLAHGGWVGSGELWSGPFEILSRNWRTITYDHRGSGATRHSAGAISFELLVGDLFRVLDALQVETCVLAGESMGAMVVLEAALRQPQRFTGLVIVDGRYSGGASAQRDALIAGCRANFNATMDAFVEACTPEPDCAAERAWGRQIVKRSNALDAVQLLQCEPAHDLLPRLGAITQPTLVLHGSLDRITPLAAAQQLVAALPRATLALAEGAGHVPTVTRPAWVAQQINDFFAG